MLLVEIQQMQFPATFGLTQDPEVWIADKGTTDHSMPSNPGSISKHKTSIMVKGVHGAVVPPTCKMDIPSIVCDKYGNALYIL